jgi:hypothetical protein
MAKWITAILGVAILALLLFLKRELGSDAVAAPTVTAAAAPAPAPVAAPATAPVAAAPVPAPVAAPAPAPAADPAPKKLDPSSDAFFYKFDEVVPAALTREAASCYEGHAHLANRNVRLKLSFKTEIRGGVVRVRDVRVVDSSLGDQALETCFVRKVSEATWRDDQLPDWVQDDQLVLRPERGMKKFMKENVEYEGSGPIGEAVMKEGQPEPPSDSATKSQSDEW